MKLIAEATEAKVDYLVEEKNGEKRYFIEGVFMQAEQKNRNGRVYPKAILESAVNEYVEKQIKEGRAVGELNHPDGPVINLDKVSHRIVDLHFEGNDVVGKALVLPTPMGKIVEGLIQGGVRLGVSSRGMGSLSRREGVDYVQSDFLLNTVDIVQDPSAHNAFVNGIMESVDWEKDPHTGSWLAKKVNKAETEVVTEALKYSNEYRLRQFANFLSKL